MPGCVAQSVARLTHEPEVPGSIPGPANGFKKDSCRLLVKVCAQSTGKPLRTGKVWLG